MCDRRIVTTADGRVCGVHSWTEGFNPLTPPRKRRLSDDDKLATALWLERQGKTEEAMAFLERHLDGDSLH